MGKLSSYQEITALQQTDLLPVLRKTGETTYANRGIKVQNIGALGVEPTVVHVNVRSGDDSTGLGSESFPYKTIQKAIDVINTNADNVGLGDAVAGVTSKPYIIEVAPGFYPESLDLGKANLRWLTIRAKTWASVYIKPAQPGGIIKCDANNSLFENLVFENLWINAKFSFKGGGFASDCSFQSCYLMYGEVGDMLVESTNMGFIRSQLFIGISAVNSALYFNESTVHIAGQQLIISSDDAKPIASWGAWSTCDDSQIASLTISGTATNPGELHVRCGSQIRGDVSTGNNSLMVIRGPNFIRGNLSCASGSSVTIRGDLTVDGNLTTVSGVSIDATGSRLGVTGTRTVVTGTITGNNVGWYNNSTSGLTADNIQSAIDELVGRVYSPPSSTDAAASNNTVYYSTTQSKLVYKDSGGTVNTLY